MVKNNSSEILHYKRGIYIINKIMKLFEGCKYDASKERQFFLSEHDRVFNTEIGVFDSNNFLFICGVALMGLNKETIENSNNSNDYNYDIDYEISAMKIGSEIHDIDIDQLPIQAQYYLKRFNENRIVNSLYDEWLSINDFNSLKGHTYNFLFNVRNSIMHSEYDFEMLNKYDFLIANLNNSNYTNFKAQIYMPKFFEFMKHYFSNDVHFGIVSNLFLYGLEEIKEDDIKDRESLLKYIKDEVKIKKINYDNKLKQDKILEKLLTKKLELTEKIIKRYNITESEIILNSDDIDQVVLSIESYFNDDFYNFDAEIQTKIIVGALKYKMDSKSVLSSWIMHFYRNMSLTTLGDEPIDEFNSLFAMKPSLQIIKSYMVLYRLQNKELSSFEINYDLLNDFEYFYDVNAYTDYKQKLIEKGIILDEEHNKMQYFMQVFRNSLCHGNIDISFKEKDDRIEQYFCFTDIYKSRTRSVTISTENLQKFLDSDAFSSKYLKDDKLATKKVK